MSSQNIDLEQSIDKFCFPMFFLLLQKMGFPESPAQQTQIWSFLLSPTKQNFWKFSKFAESWRFPGYISYFSKEKHIRESQKPQLWGDLQKSSFLSWTSFSIHHLFHPWNVYIEGKENFIDGEDEAILTINFNQIYFQ